MITRKENFNLHVAGGVAATVVLPAALLAVADGNLEVFFGAMTLHSLAAAIGVTLFWVRSTLDPFSPVLGLDTKVSKPEYRPLRKAA